MRALGDVVQNESEAEETASEVVSEDNSIQSYFTNLKLNRDNIYSQKLDAYEKMVESSSISSEQKGVAIQEIENITNTQNAILVAEELIKLKDFENVVIYANGDTASVVVRAAALSNEQVAQIQNIVSRELNIDVSNISISNK